MTVADLRQLFLDFYKEKGHAIIPSASLLPENDPTVLFTTAGMHPLVPFLIGQPHPMGKRLANAQKCLRTDDIEEVGDSRHLTFFEMLGNWSLGDYFKQEAIGWSFEFLTDPKWLAMDPKKLFVTVFEGDADAPRDEESIGIWQALFEVRGISANVGVAGTDEPTVGLEGARIYAYPKKKNWWGPAGLTGPCGPDTEMFFDTGRPHDPAFGAMCHPNCDCGRFVEIWNDVFMQYEKKADGSFVPLAQQNVDTGMGLERMAAMLQGKETVFETEIFQAIFEKIEELSKQGYRPEDDTATSYVGSVGAAYVDDAENGAGYRMQGDVTGMWSVNRAFRIIADHIRAATFVIGDPRGVAPSNVGQGYIVRRLVRRAIREGRRLGIKVPFTDQVAAVVIGVFGGHYAELETNRERILTELRAEEEKFAKTIEFGLKKLHQLVDEKINNYKPVVHSGVVDRNAAIEEMRKDSRFGRNVISGREAFDLYQSFGFPIELIQEELRRIGIEKVGYPFSFNEYEFEQAQKSHQELSRTASMGAFKGGLADHSVETTRLHTATHLLHKALKTVLGDHVEQKGSNITAERLRFDFSHTQKMTPEELATVEQIVNEAIQKDYPVHFDVMDMEQAKASGALGYFEDKYAQLGGKIKVYTVGDASKGTFSKEICGGPHVEHTGELGSFKIQKEEAVSAGIRRIKATVTGV